MDILYKKEITLYRGLIESGSIYHKKGISERVPNKTQELFRVFVHLSGYVKNIKN